MTPRERAVERIAQFAVDAADGGDLWSGMSAAERAPVLAVIRALFEELGLVAVDPARAAAVRAADAGARLLSDGAFDACEQCGMRRDWTDLTGCPSCATRRALADAVIAQSAAPKPSAGKFAKPWEVSLGFAQRCDDAGRQIAYVLTEGHGWQWFVTVATDESDDELTCAEAMRKADAALDAAGYVTTTGGSLVGQVDGILAQLGAKP